MSGMKISFIGGGSVQWALKLVTDMALNETLAGADLVLHDIDMEALELLTRACQRLVEQMHGSLHVTATNNREEALQDADFVILCVGIGGLPAMRNDLEIPQRYGVYQSVGDTVGPGGLARGLRHIPFAVQVACEMERLCSDAWLINITNPMTTICRSVARATGIRVIGLCHEVDNFRRKHLTQLFQVPAEAIVLDVAGINHLPVILGMRVNERDGLSLLRAWLAEHSLYEFTAEHIPGIEDIFHDRLAVKLSLFVKLGVLFGAGDRHVAEFLPGFLSPAAERGNRYGVILTSIEHREELARQRRAGIERFLAGETGPLAHSDEQLARAMAALAGGPAGRFIVNVPNVGQIDNLPRGAVVECMAEVDALGVRPLATGALPHAAHAVIAPHVARQELIVEAALTGRREVALAALTSDPLVLDPETVEPMLDELLAANARFMGPEYVGKDVTFTAVR
jgi:alpha-galactosidase/6-phospho-beta-glucosidase family protein